MGSGFSHIGDVTRSYVVQQGIGQSNVVHGRKQVGVHVGLSSCSQY